MCRSHQTRQWTTYPVTLRSIADQIVFPWMVLTDRCLGPHQPTGPHGSYSLLELNGDPTDAERILKVFIMEGSDPLPAGVYVGLRSHPATSGVAGRSVKERRLWDAAFTRDAANATYFGLMNPTTQCIGLTPQHHVCFAYFQVAATPSLLYLTELCKFLERCRQQFG